MEVARSKLTRTCKVCPGTGQLGDIGHIPLPCLSFGKPFSCDLHTPYLPGQVEEMRTELHPMDTTYMVGAEGAQGMTWAISALGDAMRKAG